MAITVTNNAPRVYEWADTATSDVLKLSFDYTKNRPATSLEIVATIGTTGYNASVDVSTINEGTTARLQATINIGRTPATVQATQRSVTVAGGATATLTPPAGSCYAIDAQAQGLIVRVGGVDYPFTQKVVACAGIELFNPDVTSVTATYYEVAEAGVVETVTLTVNERDANGNILDTGQATIEHAKPFTPQVNPSSIAIYWVG